MNTASAYRPALVLWVVSLYMLRMLGIFLLLPVLALYASGLPHATPLLVGLSLGLYGLSQALAQLPLGFLSDRLGRRAILLVGLLLFVLGSVVCAKAASIWGLLSGRAIQGAGAIGSTLLALIGDVIPREKRTKTMAFVGMSIGFSFLLGMTVGPWCAAHFGVPSLFVVCASLGVLALCSVYVFAPNYAERGVRNQVVPWLSIVIDSRLWRLNLSIGVTHALLTAVFVAIPVELIHQGISQVHQGWVYLSASLMGFVLGVPVVLRLERKGKVRQALWMAILFLMLAQGVWCLSETSQSWIAGLVCFFLGFNALEALLPSLVSQCAPVEHKGVASGIYSTFQCFGIFLGGAWGGLSANPGFDHLFLGALLVTILWGLCMWTFPKVVNDATGTA